MPTRLQDATEHLRDRLRTTAGVTATIYNGATVVADSITIVQISLKRLVRNEAEFQFENDDAAFLVGVDDLADPPEIGWKIQTADTVYTVTEKPELQTHWRWHDMTKTQRAVFVKEWAVVE